MDILTELSVKLLMGLSSLLGVYELPLPPIFAQGRWQITQEWQPTGDYYSMIAQSSNAGKECATRPTDILVFPRIIHGAHEVFADNKLVYKFGDPKFEITRSFYGSAGVLCSTIANARVVEWRASSYTRYFARIDRYPSISSPHANVNLFSESLNILAFGMLTFNVALALIMFRRRVPFHSIGYFIAASLLFAGYFGGTVIGLLGIEVSMKVAHKVADACVFAGIACFFYFLSARDILPTIISKRAAQAMAVVLFCFAVAPGGDAVQVGTTIAFPVVIWVMAHATILAAKRSFTEASHRTSSIFQFLSLLSFLVAIINDIMMIVGVLDTPPLLPIGIIGALIFSATSLNEFVHEVYRERDYLRHHLEAEVELKTSALNDKTIQLESAMRHLTATQAELVQSAKLASLGTLSAGIAHEINNSLNYVNGALKPLEKLVETGMSAVHRKKAAPLIHCMREGLRLTFDIISSLRTISGINRAKFDEVELTEVVKSVVTIAKSRLHPEAKLKIHVPEGLCLYCNVVGINQILLNLIINASDAMPDGGTIDVAARRQKDQVIIRVADTGGGIPDEIVDRIFDPFFTTKDVQKGSGLGLFIVKQEVDRHEGSIKIRSKVGKGTEVMIVLPAKTADHARRTAA